MKPAASAPASDEGGPIPPGAACPASTAAAHPVPGLRFGPGPVPFASWAEPVVLREEGLCARWGGNCGCGWRWSWCGRWGFGGLRGAQRRRLRRILRGFRLVSLAFREGVGGKVVEGRPMDRDGDGGAEGIPLCGGGPGQNGSTSYACSIRSSRHSRTITVSLHHRGPRTTN